MGEEGRIERDAVLTTTLLSFKQWQEDGGEGGRRAIREEWRSGRGAETTVRPRAQVSRSRQSAKFAFQSALNVSDAR